MASGITVRSPSTGGVVKDIDDLFELIRPGDPQSGVTELRVGNADLNTRFTAVSVGTALAFNTLHRVNGTDIGAIFSAKNSVPRYPNPLPWARTIPAEVTIYRQPSRPTHTVSVVLSISVNRSGAVAITLTKPPYNSNPATPVVETIYSSGDTPVWVDAGASPNCPYQVKVDAVSGITPTMAHGHTLGTWINPNTVVGAENVTMFTQLNYTHSTVEGVKTGTSTVKISLRREEYPVSNTANANVIVNFEIDVEPTVFADLAWTGTHVANNNAVTNYYWPEEQRNIYKAAVRFTLSTTRTYLLERAVWKNNETPSWTLIKSAQWLRDGFSLSDFEAMFTTAGAFDANDTAIALNQWLQLGSTARSFTIYHEVSDNTVNGTYGDSLTMTTRLQQISTKGWVGLPNNFAENAMTLAPSIVIQPPLLPTWVDPYPYEAARNHIVTITRQPEIGTPVTVGVYVRFYPDGRCIVVNEAGTELSSSRWAPAGWDATWFELKVSGTLNSNPLSTYGFPASPYTQVHYTGLTYNHTTTENTFTDDGTISVDVRRKAYTSHLDTASGTSRSQIVVNPPIAPPWIATYPWEGARNHLITITREPETNNTVTAAVLLRLYPDGTAAVVNQAGSTLATGRWLDSAWEETWFDVRVTGDVISNPLASYATPSSPYTEIVLSRQSYTHTSAEGNYSESASFDVNIRRKAYTAHNDTGSGTSISQIQVNAPVVPAWPSLAGLAGPFSESKSINHTPEGGGSTITSEISVVANMNGTVTIHNSTGAVLQTVNFLPPTLSISQVEVRIVSAGAISNSLSNWTTLATSTGAVIARRSVNADSAINTYSDSDTFTFEVRRKAYTAHSTSGSGSATASVSVIAPIAPPWIATYPWEGALNHLKSHTRNTDAPTSTVTASVTAIFYQNGGVVVVNGDGGTIASGSWVPPGFSASQFTLQVTGSNLIRNDLATAQVISAAGAAVDLTSVTYSNSQADGTYSDTANMTVTIRRAAYTAHNDSGSSTSLSRITVAPMPLLINPPSSYDDWAGTYTNSASAEL